MLNKASLLVVAPVLLFISMIFLMDSEETKNKGITAGDIDKIPPASLVEVTLPHFFSVKKSLSRSVEGDIFRPLSGYRNPCWMERLNNSTRPTINRFITNGFSNKQLTSPALEDLEKYYVWRVSQGDTRRLRCLPAFYLAGMYRAGSTDLHEAISRHPFLVPPVLKEPLIRLWDMGHYTPYRFDDYLGLFDVPAKIIFESSADEGRKSLMTYDSSSVFMHMYTHWRALPWNRNAEEPRLIIAHHLKILNPHAKFLFILRNPADWLASCYNGFHFRYKQFSSQDLHNRTETSIASFRQCEPFHDVRRCVYQHNDDPCDVLNAIYYVYMRDWLAIYDRKQVLVVKSEDYFRNKTGILEDIFSFLELPKLPDAIGAHVAKLSVVNKGKRRVKMLPQTSAAIGSFMRKWNRKLADLLGHAQPYW